MDEILQALLQTVAEQQETLRAHQVAQQEALRTMFFEIRTAPPKNRLKNKHKGTDKVKKPARWTAAASWPNGQVGAHHAHWW
ncbi:hypothetical protein AOXY_G2787 [Acipenser oxyrinchus oxyrinchus]|uniref:Uncharacterized protein n=1 Tax=Acipenser oxyrinchus oxyrinchus TaxID=40147 RepID=A0AAD8LUH5_ACIOX|nr:hypothetical protein AOXY_G2787 [Acipenser oxyrinchus oxyrinchus]